MKGFRTLSNGKSVEVHIESDSDGRTKSVDVTRPEKGPVQGRRGGGSGVYGFNDSGGRGGVGRGCREAVGMVEVGMVEAVVVVGAKVAALGMGLKVVQIIFKY
ncbi:unnamed protein product [Prunus armeniaca]